MKRALKSAMFYYLKTLCFCLILAALFAPSALAVEVIIDPGPVGSEAITNTPFTLPNEDQSLEIKFADNKTLEFGPQPPLIFSIQSDQVDTLYTGFLTDEQGIQIVGTDFSGGTELGLTQIFLPESTVWSGLTITGDWVDESRTLYFLLWLNSPKPIVGTSDPVPEPNPVTIGGTVSGLVEGGVLVLQNNGADDLEITEDGPFTFATTLTPGDSYNVTVFTQPEGQTCSVANGSGQVADQNVRDVAVTCAEPIVVVFKVAAEDETLTDDTLLKQILLDGGVAINIDGQVAFGGRDGDNTIAVFTQDGKVAAEGKTLEDGTTVVNDISSFGEVAISADRVAFHGRTGRDKAVFTQAGLVAKEDDILTSGTLNEIKDQGKVAINDFDVVAFHGKIEIEGEDGLGDTEEFSAVFTSDGLETRVAVREGSELPDTSTVEAIDETGGVAINDFFGEVAFHGDVVDPGTGGDTKKAVFTSAGLVAKEGDILTDGNILEEINESGGVAINIFGDVAFHGRTGNVKAVFTQHGLIAKEGDILADSTILSEIHNNGGVAINPYGDEVAFHGKVGNTDAVFVGLVPVPEPVD